MTQHMVDSVLTDDNKIDVNRNALYLFILESQKSWFGSHASLIIESLNEDHKYRYDIYDFCPDPKEASFWDKFTDIGLFFGGEVPLYKSIPAKINHIYYDTSIDEAYKILERQNADVPYPEGYEKKGKARLQALLRLKVEGGRAAFMTCIIDDKIKTDLIKRIEKDREVIKTSGMKYNVQGLPVTAELLISQIECCGLDKEFRCGLYLMSMLPQVDSIHKYKCSYVFTKDSQKLSYIDKNGGINNLNLNQDEFSKVLQKLDESTQEIEVQLDEKQELKEDVITIRGSKLEQDFWKLIALNNSDHLRTVISKINLNDSNNKGIFPSNNNQIVGVEKKKLLINISEGSGHNCLTWAEQKILEQKLDLSNMAMKAEYFCFNSKLKCPALFFTNKVPLASDILNDNVNIDNEIKANDRNRNINPDQFSYPIEPQKNCNIL